MNNPITAIEFEGINYKYPGAEISALKDISFSVPKNSLSIITGPTGSGKSTLLKIARGLHHEYGGDLHGSFKIFGEDAGHLKASDLGSRIAIIFQNPSYQLHQSRVIDELMSAPIYQALPWQECMGRAKQSADDILINKLLDRSPSELSQGEQQKVALAASLTMKAEIILMDEPFAYMDVKAFHEFLQLIKDLKQNGKTIILATHDLGSIAEIAEEIILMDESRIVLKGKPKEVLYSVEMKEVLNGPLFVEVGKKLHNMDLIKKLPVSWKDLAENLNSITDDTYEGNVGFLSTENQEKPVLEIDSISFMYPNSERGVRNITLNVRKSEILGIIGSNGSGKTTLAKLMLGFLKPMDGYVNFLGARITKILDLADKVGYMTQNPSEMLFETTVFRECSFGPITHKIQDYQPKVKMALSKLGLQKYSDRDPRSLSVGEQRLLTLADIIVNNPQLLILDEPEFGLDSKTLRFIKSVIRGLRDEGKTIILITQNLEFAALLCDRISLMKQGEILKTGKTSEIFRDRGLIQNAGLRDTPFLSVYKQVKNESEKIISEEEFISALSSSWPRKVP